MSALKIAAVVLLAAGILGLVYEKFSYTTETHEAKIVQVNRYGLVVHLPAFNVGGFVPARTIGDRAVLKGPTLTLHRGKTPRSFTEGYAVRVRIQDVDFVKLQVLLEVAG